jgi:hypothetical protein
MAREVAPELADLYGIIYLEGTNQAHANSLGMERRLQDMDGRFMYKSLSEEEAALALHFAHRLLLKLLAMQNKYFDLNLDEAIEERVAIFRQIWPAGTRFNQH